MRTIRMSAIETIKKIRHCLNISQKELGDRLCLSRTMICRWESGSYMPTHHYIKELMTLAKENKVDITLEDFYND